jgi:uncharacterized protein (TIGR00369 family)
MRGRAPPSIEGAWSASIAATAVSYARRVSDGTAATPAIPYFLLNQTQVVRVEGSGAEVAIEVRPWLDGTPDIGVHAATVTLADMMLTYGATTRMSAGLMPVSLGLRLDYWRRPAPVGTRLIGRAGVVEADGDVLLVRGQVEDDGQVLATATLRAVLTPIEPVASVPSGAPLPRAAVVAVVPTDGPWVGPAGDVEGILRLRAAALFGLELVRAGDGVVELSARPGADLERTQGVVHGGAVPVMGQLACAAALASAGLDQGRRLDTATEFLRPTAVGKPLRTLARVVHRSRRVAMVHAEVVNADGRPTARVYETVAFDG